MRKITFILFLGLVGLTFGQTSVRLSPVVQAVRKAAPCLVSIGTEQVVLVNDPYITRLNEYFSLYRYHSRRVKEYMPLGSGVILDSCGLVLTNYHVVKPANRILVRLRHDDDQEPRSYTATVVGFDVPGDLALLKLQGDLPKDGLPEATFAASGDLLLGETVLAMGNPFGLENSVSQGIVSAINRRLGQDDIYGDILQTDAAVNPGNSGGPLINLDAQVIGLNQAILNAAQSIGFAIPVSRIEEFLSRWLTPECFGNMTLGIAYTPAKEGVSLIVAGDGPAAQAKLKTGDVVTAINGQPVKRMLDFGRNCWNLTTDRPVELLLKDGRKVNVTPASIAATDLLAWRLGLQVQKLTPGLNRVLELPEKLRGLIISEVLQEPEFKRQKSQWRELLKRGDLILEVNNEPVTSLVELTKILKTRQAGETLILGVAILDERVDRYRKTKLEVILK